MFVFGEALSPDGFCIDTSIVRFLQKSLLMDNVVFMATSHSPMMSWQHDRTKVDKNEIIAIYENGMVVLIVSGKIHDLDK